MARVLLLCLIVEGIGSLFSLLSSDCGAQFCLVPAAPAVGGLTPDSALTPFFGLFLEETVRIGEEGSGCSDPEASSIHGETEKIAAAPILFSFVTQSEADLPCSRPLQFHAEAEAEDASSEAEPPHISVPLSATVTEEETGEPCPDMDDEEGDDQPALSLHTRGPETILLVDNMQSGDFVATIASPVFMNDPLPPKCESVPCATDADLVEGKRIETMPEWTAPPAKNHMEAREVTCLRRYEEVSAAGKDGNPRLDMTARAETTTAVEVAMDGKVPKNRGEEGTMAMMFQVTKTDEEPPEAQKIRAALTWEEPSVNTTVNRANGDAGLLEDGRQELKPPRSIDGSPGLEAHDGRRRTAERPHDEKGEEMAISLKDYSDGKATEPTRATNAPHGPEGTAGRTVCERIERLVEGFSKVQQESLIVRFNVDDERSVTITLKDGGDRVRVDVRTSDESVMTMLRSEKDTMVRDLEDRHVNASIVISPDARNGRGRSRYPGRGHDRSGDRQDGKTFGTVLNTFA